MIRRRRGAMFWQLVVTLIGALSAASAEGQSGVNLSDLSQNSAEFWRDYYARLSRRQQPLDVNTSVEVTAQAGGRAVLSCPVRNLGDRPVSWIRQRDFHVISSRSTQFTKDERFHVRRVVGASEDWPLSIEPAVESDSGVYVCQVSTGKGSLSRFVNLTVVRPVARLVGASVYRIEKNSVITLLCVIDNAIAPVPDVRWWHNNRTKLAGGRAQIETSGGLAPGGPRSQLHVRDVTFLDSGEYRCGGDHLRPASVQVFVTEGDKTAAIQRRSGAGRAAPGLLGAVLCWLAAR